MQRAAGWCKAEADGTEYLSEQLPERRVRPVDGDGCARSWRQSRGLEKPKTPPPNDSKWSRRKLDEASTMYIDDTEFWEKKYPGYTLNRVETKVSDGGMRHTIVILRRAECWHGRGNIKQTRRRPV